MSTTRWRLGTILVALVLVVVATVGVLAERSLRARELERLKLSLAQQAALVRSWSDRVPLEQGAAELDRIVRRAARAAEARVTVIAASGAVLADSEVAPEDLARVENHGGRPEVVAALAGRVGTNVRRSRTVGRGLLYLGVPARGGVVRLAVDLASVEAQVSALRRSLALAAGIGALLALALSAIVSSAVSRRVDQLRAAAAAMARGEAAPPLATSPRDELGQIAMAVEELNLQLQGRIQEATAEKERLQAVLQGMAEGVLVLDAADRVLLANPQLREWFGCWSAVEGRTVLEVTRSAVVEEALARVAESSEPVRCDVVPSGEEGRTLEMHAARFPNEGAALGTVAVFRDLTELRRLERVRSEFVANVSHELKTPITAISGYAETLAANDLEPERRADYLDVILRQAGRLNALIEDLLELSRIEGRREPLRCEPVPLEPLIRGLLGDLAPRLASRSLQADIEGSAAPALADRRALEQILMNLLDNACKYTEPGGHIAVRLGAEGGRVLLEVADDGIGIPEPDHSRVFERFFRVDKARSRDLGGTGLGLAIVKHLVQAMSGDVVLESQEGVGSRFRVLLPSAS